MWSVGLATRGGLAPAVRAWRGAPGRPGLRGAAAPSPASPAPGAARRNGPAERRGSLRTRDLRRSPRPSPRPLEPTGAVTPGDPLSTRAGRTAAVPGRPLRVWEVRKVPISRLSAAQRGGQGTEAVDGSHGESGDDSSFVAPLVCSEPLLGILSVSVDFPDSGLGRVRYRGGRRKC